MDGNPLPQDDSDVTERSHRRRLSSILKVPRSPLRDLGNVLHQDSTTEKRRKSRRVSFAENIRVFSLESQIAADDNGQVTVSGNENEDGMKSRFQITGMDTLLHGPIQTPAPQPERDCADNEKTLFFSCDNDMEMTSSNTINIDAFLEEKTDKIDVTSFLASLKSHGEDSCESVKLNPSTTIDFHSSSESEVQPKINFKDFLTGLKTEKQTVCPFQGNDKENFFSFSISNEKSTPGSDVFSTFAQRQEEKENITQVFTEQDDGLDMTKCHTTNITAFVPVTDAFPYHFEPNTISFPKAPSSHEHLQGGLQLQKLKTVSKNQTVLLEDDMDITQNRSVCLDNVLSKTRSGGNTQALNKGMGVCPADKTVFFTDSNEMEFTQNHTVAINTNTGAGDPLLHKKNLLNAENNFVSPDNSMDLTKSHTVAIDGRSMVASCASTSTSLPDALGNRNNVGDPIYFSKSILRQNQDPSLPFHLTAEKTIAFDDEDMDLNTSNTAHIMFGLGSNISMHRKSIPVMPTSHLFIMNDKTVVSNQDMDLTQCTTTVLDTDSCYGLQSSNETCSEQKVVRKSGFLPKPPFSSDQHQSSHFEEDKPFNNTVASSKSMPSTVADKTLLFSCNQDDMEITKSHTVAIDKFLQDPDLAKIPENVSKGKTVKPGGLRLSSFSKHVLFPKASNDVELIKGNTVNEKPWQKAKESCQPSSDHQEKAPTFNKSCADTKISETRAVENMTMRGLTTNFKNIVGTFPSSHNKTILSLENMDLTVTTKNAFRDEGTFPTEEVKTGITAQDKTILFSCEEENMDMTRSHTVTIDRKDLCKGSKNAINMLSTKNVSTFSSELDFIESHTLTRENKVSVVDEYLKLASNVKSTSKAIPDCVHNTVSDKRSENRNVPLSEEKTMFSPSEDYMDFTQSCTVAIENNLCEELKTAKTTSQKFDLSKSVALDKTVEDNMELTKSHTMVISAKCPDKHHHQSFATKTNTEAGFGEDDMDITKSNTIFINEIPEISKGLVKSSALRRKSAPEPKRSCFANDKTMYLEGDMEMTTANIGPLINDIPRVKNVGLDKTVVFSREQDNMDLTLSHTVAIESKGLCELNLDAKNKPGHYSKQTPLPLNKTVHMVEDDMELTRSHTMVINEQPAELHLQSDPVNKSNSDDMDITKSNTVFIKETEIFKGQVDLSILKKTSASGSRRSYVSDKTVRLEGDMEMTAANVGQVINGAPYPVQRKSIGLSHDKTLVFSSEQEHMDLTMSHTIAIESKGICEVAKALNPNVNCSVLSSVPVNKSTVILEDDMDLTKSHTMVISKNDPSNSAHKRNYSTDFGQDNMEITRSDTIFIDDMPVAERSKGQLNCLLKRESVCLKGSDFSVLLDGDMELTRAGTGLLVSDTNVPSTETTLGSCNNKTMLFSCEQDNMDLTVANTVAIESKGLCEGSETRNLGVKRILGSSSKHSSVPENKAFTMFAEEMEMTKSHTMVIEQKTPLLDEYNSVDKQSLVSETSEADGMDITKSNTVFIDSHIDGLCKTSLGSKKQNLPLAQQSCSTNEPLHGDTVAKMRGKNGRSSNVFQGYDQGNTDIDMSHTAVTKQSALNKEVGNSDRFQNDIDPHSAPACKTIVFSTLEDDMDLTKSHTMVIDGRNILKGENVSSRQPGQITANSDKSVAFSSDDMDFTLSPSARLEKGIFELAQHEEMINILSKAKKGNILELQRPFLNKYATVNFSVHEGDVEFTKSHTVAIELDNQTPSTALNKQGMEPETNMGKSMKSLVKGGRIVSDANMDVGNIYTSKTLCNLNDMDMTRSLTVAIENKTEELQIMVAADPKNCMAENPENLRIPLSTSNPNVFVPDLGEKNLNEMVFCEDADKTSPMDQQETKVVEIGLSDTKNFSSVASLEPAEHINRSEEPVLADEACMPHIDTTDLKTTKKARPKSKRVSFMLPEPEAGSCVPKANVLEASTKPTTEINMDVCNLKQNSSMAILGNSADKEGETVKSMADYYDANDGLAQGSLVHCKPKEQNISPGNVGNLEQEDQDTLSCKGPVLKSSNLVEFSEADKMRRRRSIADIQSKIRSLNKNSKSFPDSQTAPVTFLVDHLSTSLQAPTVSLTNKSEDILEDAELSSKLPIHEKPNLYTPADDVASHDKETTSKETNLPNKLSVKVFQAKLPQKTNPNKCNVQESSSFYEAHVKPERNSLTLLKALTNCNSSQCIDEEILPLSPDEKDHDGIFHYEVPEGAWEELCEKEALHCSLEQDITASQDGINDKKRNREPEETNEFQKEKRGRTEGMLNSDKSKASVTIASPDDYQISEFSSLHLTKTIEQTNYSSNSSQDSRGDGMHMELSCSQQCSQMESQLPWDTGCEQSLWVKFQDGTITVKEFFMLLRIRILIQKPRYSELPANYRANKAAMTEDLLLDQYIYQPKLQVYEEECHALGQIIQELKTFAETQEKPLMQVNSLLWEAMRMCSEDEVIYFGVKLKSLKSLYSKKSKVLAHERKVTVYSKLLHVAQTRCEQLQSRINEVDTFLEETDKCISELQSEIDKLDEDIQSGNLINMDPTVKGLQTELEKLQTEEVNSLRECAQLEDRKDQVLTQLGCLQEQANKMEKQLEEFNFTEWDLDKWTEDQAIFTFLYDSIELCIQFGDVVDGMPFVSKPCRRLSMVTFDSQLNEEAAPPSSLLAHTLIMQFIERNGCFYEKYKTQQDLPQMLFDLSLAMSRCRLLGEEVDYLMKWGAKYNILKIQVQSTEVKLLFSSSLAYAKFELVVHLSESYPTLPLTFTFRNHIGKIGHSNISAVLSEVPVGMWYLKRAVRRIHRQLLA